MSLLKKANNQDILISEMLFTFTLFVDLFILFIVYYLFIAESSKTFQ